MKRQHKNTFLVCLFLILAIVFRMQTAGPSPGETGTPAEGEQVAIGVAASDDVTLARSEASQQLGGNTVAPQRSDILAQQGDYTEYRYYLQAEPNDPYYDDNWAQAKVQASRAWDMTTGSSDVVVAVVDSGFALNHQDLTGRWQTNAAEQGTTSFGDICWTGISADKSTNNCDDDSNGYVDDWQGYDFYNDDNNVQAGLTNPSGDAVDHGTLVSGTIGATGNNLLGGTGMSWSASIMPLQIFSDDGEAYTSHVVEAVEYAVDNGADIINLSLGTNAPDSALLAAVRYAQDNEVLVVAASGNCVGSSDPFCTALPDAGRMLYPANFTEVLSVGATTSSDTRASFSGYGPQLDMTAPGVSVGPLPTYNAAQPTTSYVNASGTSFATPMVAGSASLVLAQNPGLSVAELREVLLLGAEKVTAMGSSYRTDVYGVGRLNVYRSVLTALAYSEQTDELGSAAISHRQPPTGYAWRSQSGDVDDDEWIAVGCRVAAGTQCSVVATGGTTVRFTSGLDKAGDIQFIYLRGLSLPSGGSTITVHSTEYGQSITTLTR